MGIRPSYAAYLGEYSAEKRFPKRNYKLWI